MSLCVMSERSVRRLNRTFPGLDIVHAAAHHTGRIVFCTNSRLECFWLDRSTREVEPAPQGTWAKDRVGS